MKTHSILLIAPALRPAQDLSPKAAALAKDYEMRQAKLNEDCARLLEIE